MNTYLTVRDVLDTARRFHRDLTRFYNRLTRESDRERLRLLLDFMRRHEDNLARTLDQYEQQGQEHLLETWLQYGPEEEPLELPPIREMADDMRIDDIQDAALEFDDALASFYADAAERVQNDEVRALFRTLVEQHEDDKAKITKNVLSAKQDI